MERLLWYVFAGSRGGPTRVRVVQALHAQPRNTNQLAKDLEMDFKSIDYQLRVLAKHTFVVRREEGYGMPWEVSKNLLAAWDTFVEISEVGKTSKRRGRH